MRAVMVESEINILSCKESCTHAQYIVGEVA